MIYIDDNGRMQCTECCISCNTEKRVCGARKERKRLTNRMTYRAKKEYKKKLKEGD